MTDKWQNRIVEYRDILVSEIVPNPMNPKEHPDFQLQILGDLIGEVGIVQNIMVNRRTGHLVDGEGRYKLALANNEVSLPGTVIDVSEEEERKILLAFDEISVYAKRNSQRMSDIIQSVIARSIGLKNLVNAIAEKNRVNIQKEEDEPEVGEIVEENHQETQKKNDELDELTEQMGVRVGDIWKLDKDIYIMCGDSRESNDVQSLLDASGFEMIHNVFTSPPYAEQRKKEYGGIPEEEYVAWWKEVQSNCRAIMMKSGNFFLNIKPHTRDDSQKSLYVFDLIQAMVRQYGWMFIEEFCWLKSSMPKEVIKHFKNGFEPVYQFTMSREFMFYPKNVAKISDNVPNATGEGTGNTSWAAWQGKGVKNLGEMKGVSMGLSYPSNVLTAYSRKSFGHEAAFPEDLVDFFILAYSASGNVWYDPFAGSGTVGSSALTNDRKAIMMEILPKYVALTIDRFTKELNTKPVKIREREVA